MSTKTRKQNRLTYGEYHKLPCKWFP
ncbi:unnamed protein product [Acanthoscelides obtectus]|uniref:Uncharacterized protein n=1 Tax=Acanthoscelides obtectus TaxID=200917 RepID=A0A9P0KK12_ACAOB|nr:unnamed protein product [Acanthoscelides obtectus]CAK1651950.1 hypothetical protein AOBTE_LOCUS17571 [Acanthoscelides obtectus]